MLIKIECPIDNHLCGREDCWVSQTKNCQKVVENIAMYGRLIDHAISLFGENESLGIDDAQTLNQIKVLKERVDVLIEKKASQLGINPIAFKALVQSKIDKFGKDELSSS